MKRHLIYKVKSVVKITLFYLLAIIAMMAMFIGAVLQQSYRMTPPTDAEIAECPALNVYRGE